MTEIHDAYRRGERNELKGIIREQAAEIERLRAEMSEVDTCDWRVCPQLEAAEAALATARKAFAAWCDAMPVDQPMRLRHLAAALKEPAP